MHKQQVACRKSIQDESLVGRRILWIFKFPETLETFRNLAKVDKKAC